MALKEFATGLKMGATPLIAQKMKDKAADKQKSRQLDYMKKLGMAKLQQDLLGKQMMLEQEIDSLSKFTQNVPGMTRDRLGLRAMGQKPESYGMAPIPGSVQDIEQKRGTEEFDMKRQMHNKKMDQLAAQIRSSDAMAKDRLSSAEYNELMRLLQARDKYKEKTQYDDYSGQVVVLDPGDPAVLTAIDQNIMGVLNKMMGSDLSVKKKKGGDEKTTGVDTLSALGKPSPVSIDTLMQKALAPSSSTGTGDSTGAYDHRMTPEYQDRLKRYMDRGMTREQAEKRLAKLIADQG